MQQCIVGNVGNTYAEFARAEQGILREYCRILTADLLNGTIPELFQQFPDTPSFGISVVPAATTLEHIPVRWLTAADPCPVDLSLMDTSTLGVDRIANAVAAADSLELPALLIDCGTAITMEYVNKEKQFCGGAILPGRRLMRYALHNGTAQLPEIPLSGELPKEEARNTVDALRLGIDGGIVGAVDGLIRRIASPEDAYVTGGDAAFLQKNLSYLKALPSRFTLQGVLCWCSAL